MHLGYALLLVLAMVGLVGLHSFVPASGMSGC